jgi:hypothetical protein
MKLYKSREWLVLRYNIQKKTIIEMADEAGCSHQTIYNHLLKHGIVQNPRRMK